MHPVPLPVTPTPVHAAFPVVPFAVMVSVPVSPPLGQLFNDNVMESLATGESVICGAGANALPAIVLVG